MACDWFSSWSLINRMTTPMALILPAGCPVFLPFANNMGKMLLFHKGFHLYIRSTRVHFSTYVHTFTIKLESLTYWLYTLNSVPGTILPLSYTRRAPFVSSRWVGREKCSCFNIMFASYISSAMIDFCHVRRPIWATTMNPIWWHMVSFAACLSANLTQYICLGSFEHVLHLHSLSSF